MSVPTLRCRTSGPEDTRALAAAVAEHLEAGDVVALSGELGAGKTCFVQGAARQLGVDGRVTSPTFMLVRIHQAEGGLQLVHVDVYRLNDLSEVRDLGDEVFATDVVTFLEWGDAVEPLLPDDRIEVEIVLGADVEDREVVLRGHGAWEPRLARIAGGLAAWSDVLPPTSPTATGDLPPTAPTATGDLPPTAPTATGAHEDAPMTEDR